MFATHIVYAIDLHGNIERRTSELPKAVVLAPVRVSTSPDIAPREVVEALRRLANAIEEGRAA